MIRTLFFLPFLMAGCSSTRLPTPVERHVDYSADVSPIFKKYCYKCHAAQKQNGNYRLDVQEIALKPDVILLGNSAESPLIHHLIGSHDRSRMPPEKPFLTDGQIAIVRAWIDQGAIWDETSK